jgi:DNA-binding CsgD family transcriptional regulator
MLVAVGRALTAVRTGEPGLAAEELERLAPFRGVVVAPLLVTDRLLGRLAHVLGRSEEAHGHFEDALRFCRSAGYTPELAWTCHDYAQALLEGDGQGRPRSPVDLLDEAAALASRLGMGPLAERVARLRRERRGGPPHGLTPRELDVLRLVAAGRTNREIARRLSISPHTVAVHVGHILEKTGRRNRTEAASLAIREGLAERAGA